MSPSCNDCDCNAVFAHVFARCTAVHAHARLLRRLELRAASSSELMSCALTQVAGRASQPPQPHRRAGCNGESNTQAASDPGLVWARQPAMPALPASALASHTHVQPANPHFFQPPAVRDETGGAACFATRAASCTGAGAPLLARLPGKWALPAGHAPPARLVAGRSVGGAAAGAVVCPYRPAGRADVLPAWAELSASVCLQGRSSSNGAHAWVTQQRGAGYCYVHARLRA